MGSMPASYQLWIPISTYQALTNQSYYDSFLVLAHNPSNNPTLLKEITNIIAKNTENCFIKTDKKLVVTNGIKDLLVINTNDALLVSKKNNSQEIKEIVKELQNAGMKEGKENKKTFRPWGNYISLVEDKRWQVKLISVKPGEQLSQQKHHHRSEHWIVVSGTAKVELDKKESILAENQSVYIPLGSIHRLSNPGKITLLIIEVQSGTYLGEDDIERFQDNYGRISN